MQTQQPTLPSTLIITPTSWLNGSQAIGSLPVTLIAAVTNANGIILCTGEIQNTFKVTATGIIGMPTAFAPFRIPAGRRLDIVSTAAGNDFFFKLQDDLANVYVQNVSGPNVQADNTIGYTLQIIYYTLGYIIQ